jgi:hypothetical protein
MWKTVRNMTNTYNGLVGRPKGKDNLKDLDVDEGIILKGIKEIGF